MKKTFWKIFWRAFFIALIIGVIVGITIFATNNYNKQHQATDYSFDAVSKTVNYMACFNLNCSSDDFYAGTPDSLVNLKNCKQLKEIFGDDFDTESFFANIKGLSRVEADENNTTYKVTASVCYGDKNNSVQGLWYYYFKVVDGELVLDDIGFGAKDGD